MVVVTQRNLWCISFASTEQVMFVASQQYSVQTANSCIMLLMLT